jgi:hypothetical protein
VWLDIVTREVSRGRVVPADRAGVRRVVARFGGQDLEVALEATTGWQFVVGAAATGGGELGDVRRFSSSREAVRYDGMDITVRGRIDTARHLSRQGPPTLRWALYEAAQAASRAGSPDREYYLQGWSPRAQPQHPLDRAHAPPGESRSPPGASVERCPRPCRFRRPSIAGERPPLAGTPLRHKHRNAATTTSTPEA